VSLTVICTKSSFSSVLRTISPSPTIASIELKIRLVKTSRSSEELPLTGGTVLIHLEMEKRKLRLRENQRKPR